MYFPKSQITTNQYTNGGEYVYAVSKLPYIGYYFKVSTGKYYTGKTPDDRPNEELLFIAAQDYPENPQISSQIIIDPIYDYLTNSNSSNPPVLIPYYSPVLPTTQDYQNGEFQRYFCKKTNETTREEYDDSFLHEIWFSTCVTILITSALLISYNLY